MRCSKCRAENPVGKKFCGDCGAPLANLCPKCRADNPAGKRFCGECGTALGASATVASSGDSPIRVADVPAAETLDGERKTVTALFADIKGSMDLMENLDPEEARAIVDPALKLMMDAVHRYEGYVAQSTGDGIFALFGAPVAYEDHPQRALHAARRMQDDLKRYANKLREQGQPPLLVRVGINSGEVVVRSIQTGDAHTEYTPIGHSVSLASRLQTLAAPGSVVIGESVRKFVDGYFQLNALGASRIKGVSEPVNVYEVTGLGPLRTRLQRSAERGFTKFVGREREMGALKHAAELAKQGYGQIAAAIADPGVGKSRLFFEFKAMNQSEWMVLETFSVSHGKASAYLPVIELLKDYFQIAADDDVRRRREKITGKVLTLDRALEDALPYVLMLLGPDESGETTDLRSWQRVGADESGEKVRPMDPRSWQRGTLDAIKRILLRESLKQPLIVVFEDLHWVDDATQALLKLLGDSIGNARILLLVNYRPEYRHEWGSKTYYTQLRLDPLGRAGAEELVSTLIGDAVELRPLKRLILEKTEGNPFFIEEMVQALFEAGTLLRDGEIRIARSMSEIHVPPTVQGILASRIDRLPVDEKALLQTLAVIGKEVPLGLIRGVTYRSDEELERMLEVLQLGEFIYEQPAFPESVYTFKHALTQEVAYGSLLIERRKELHETTAQQIEALFRSRLEDHYEGLAHHYSCSSNNLKAVEYLQLAAQQSIQRSANTEAITHLAAALKFLNTLQDTPQRDRRELTIQTMLGPALIATKGNGAPEVGAVYKRALQLGRQFGEGAKLFPVLFGLRSFHLVRAELQSAFELAEQLMRLAENLQDPDLLVEAHLAQGNSLLLFGKLAPALEHIERTMSLYDPRAHQVHAFVYGSDPGVFSLCRMTWILQLLGYPDQASKRMREALALAQGQSHAYSLAVALVHACNDHTLKGEWLALQQQAEAAIALCTEQEFGAILAQATMFRGHALAHQRPATKGIALMREGLDAQFAGGASLFRHVFLSYLAEAYQTAGQFDDGLTAVAEAFVWMERTGERFQAAELYRQKGDLLLRRAGVEALPDIEAEAERCYRKSIETARQQEARFYELKAATNLSRLWSKQGRKAEARNALAETYRWFSEGLDTRDLKEARALLAELS